MYRDAPAKAPTCSSCGSPNVTALADVRDEGAVMASIHEHVNLGVEHRYRLGARLCADCGAATWGLGPAALAALREAFPRLRRG